MADVIVGRFALIDLIAKGGSGAVWRAWDSKAGALCAAKVLRQRDSADLMRFVREKGVSFDHPHLLTPYGWGAEDEHVVIAMPLASGGTLESVVRGHGPLGEPAVVVILDQLLDGLAHVHADGWIHRDVKPANMMLEPTGVQRPHSRLADFGIAVHETDVRFTSVGMVNGTPGYMAPELFSMAEPHPSHDLYAAGVVAMFALNGPFPLRDGAFRAEELDHRLRGVSPKLAAVIRRMVDPQPERRYQDAAAVRSDLPHVPSGLRLAFADGAPLDVRSTLPPLPPDAPGAQRPQVPARSGPSMEEIRAGRVEQAYTSRGPGARGRHAPAPPTQQAHGTQQAGATRHGPPQQGAQPQQGMPQQGMPPQRRSGGSGPSSSSAPSQNRPNPTAAQGATTHAQRPGPPPQQRNPVSPPPMGSYPYGQTPRDAAGRRLVDSRRPPGSAAATAPATGPAPAPSRGSASRQPSSASSAGTGERPSGLRANSVLSGQTRTTLIGAGVGVVAAVVLGVPTAILLVSLL
ncbi:serine/threonine-protein kinase [Brachybacterium endophyticum]|uniref:serine/threonine-protein kinase n=1 Tax=Brachybacterium endophyticum TaxID=2182385 RepID=UPI001F0B9146|nr:serine/threonine-protein kinase [Brachybacterium endophyticum]